VAAAVALATPSVTRARVRIVRGATLAPGDTVWARTGGVVVHWPAAGATSEPVLGWEGRVPADTVGAVMAGSAVVVAPFARASRPPRNEEVTTVARWVDGEPAAIERRLGDGCVRAVAIPVPPVGDLALRPPFRHLLGALAAPCAHVPDETPVPGQILAALRGTGGPALAAALPAPAREPAPIARWLLGAALALALLEPLARRDRTER
jgi:hypothetical protein